MAGARDAARDDLAAAARTVHAVLPPTPQYRWPLLEAQVAPRPDDGTELWLKHENHTPVGAFKIRGGLVYFERLLASGVRPVGVVSATRGNHGQSIGFAARRHGLAALVVVPRGNSREKNAAMRALGVELVEHGDDFQAAREHAQALAAQRGWHMVPSFHPDLVAGVASYALELFDAQPRLDAVYVPIGLGSGACGLIAARDALGLATEVIGVVSTGAPAYALSLAQGAPVSHAVTTVLADGMACRTPEPQALAILAQGLARVVQVSDDEVAGAMRRLYECTHQVAEGAGAAALAAALQEAPRLAGRRTALVLSGGNVDRQVYAQVLADRQDAPFTS
ncbi:MAG: threonine dehydratase [Burkholderiales bacterium]|nr:threonine dehydratase [Burkholderiales bacterium]